MTTVRGQILVSRTDDDPCLPCMDSERPRVYVQNVPVCTGTTRTCFNTCAHGAGIHGDVLNVHTEAFLTPNTCFPLFFGVPQHTHTHQTHTTTTNNTTTTTTHTHHTTQHTTSHGDIERDRERQRKRDRERRQRKRDKTREDKRRRHKTRR